MIKFETKEQFFKFLDANVADIKQKVSAEIKDMRNCRVAFYVSIFESWDKDNSEKIKSVIERRN